MRKHKGFILNPRQFKDIRDTLFKMAGSEKYQRREEYLIDAALRVMDKTRDKKCWISFKDYDFVKNIVDGKFNMQPPYWLDIERGMTKTPNKGRYPYVILYSVARGKWQPMIDNCTDINKRRFVQKQIDRILSRKPYTNYDGKHGVFGYPATAREQRILDLFAQGRLHPDNFSTKN